MAIGSGMKELAQDIASSHEERAKRVEGLKKEVQQIRQDSESLIKGLRVARREAGNQLRKDLSQGKIWRKSEVKGLLGDFQSSRKEMGDALRKELRQGVESRKSEVKEMLGDFDKAQTEVRKDLKEAHDTWQELISKKKAVVKAPPKVKKVEEEKVETPVAEEEVPDWEKKLLTAVDEHPDGITLAEVAESLGIAPVVLGRASRSLLERGEIRKEEKLYFPVTEEES